MIAIVVLTLVFEGAVISSQAQEPVFADLSSKDCSGFFDAFECVVEVVFDVVIFLFDLITFNIDGAPWWIRVPLAFILGGGIIWAVASLVRGGS